MKKIIKNSPSGSISEMMNHITSDMYTRQTLVSLFRCFLETIMESKYDSVILVKVNNSQSFEGLLNRLKYSDAKVYVYSDGPKSENFKHVCLDYPGLKHDEFLIILAERFSACLFWDESSSDVFGLSQGFCSLNPQDTMQIINYLQSISYDESLNNDLAKIKQDRRHNERFTTILRKLVASLENRQRDLICANTELKDLHEKTLQSEKLAAVGQLCSTIAHELRNPLGMIDLYAKIITKNVEKLNQKVDDEKITESLTNAASSISNATAGLEKLLTELIDYSKPLMIEKNCNNLEEAVNEVISLIKPAFDEKNVSLAFECSLDSRISVSFDKFKLNQAVLNVLKNALEVSKAGDTVKISLDCRSGDEVIYIKIQDQGAGISPENRAKIFTPYFTTKKEGTGLGLAQSRKIMEAHGGDLLILSTSPKGTTFALTLRIEEPYE